MEMSEDPQCTLRGLNERLRGFLEHVNGLQEDNQRLQEQILEWGRRNGPRLQDWTPQERTAAELRAQVSGLLMENAQLALQSDTVISRASQLQTRCEAEEKLTRRLEQQVALLRETLRGAEHANMFLETQLRESMNELQQMHDDQEEALSLLQQHAGLSTDVLVWLVTGEDGTGMELSQLLDRFQTQCERLGPANGTPGPAAEPNPAPGSEAGPSTGAFAQVDGVWAQVSQGEEAIREARAELSEARKQWHSLQVEIESLHALERGLESSLRHTKQQYSCQLQDLSRVVQGLEGELDEVRSGLTTQRQRHHQLLDTKMKLEREIATYRKLLERVEGRFHGHNGQVMGLKPWNGPVAAPQQNGLDHSPEDPEEVQPLTELHSSENGMKKSPAMLRRHRSLGMLTAPEKSTEGKIFTVATQEIMQGNVMEESAEGHGTVDTEEMDKEIKQWEGSFFKGNPKLRKKSVSLRFDLHMAMPDEGVGQTKQDSLPGVEVRLVMKRSRSIPTIAQ